ncbi:serpin family protein [Yinghuangia soli]|uniref:Serpin domain-containing protein n=1 Tax=Yinghuangia soli TaxID=2908204 RepID=A0AA41U1G1_9ACTN|nr:serpin family protein [Yinghuangia soli]MCF2527522.1 hypothetical protein [Yinghuangia soli]
MIDDAGEAGAMYQREEELTLREYAGEIRELGSRWLDGVLSDPQVEAAGGDAVCSPAGLWLALAAISCGALGDTADELADLVGLAGPEAAPLVTAVARDLAGTDALAAATGIWSRAPLREEFAAGLPDVGCGPLGDPAAIAAWIRDATGGLVDKPPAAPGPDTRLILVNALALRARWAEAFAPADTREAVFRPAAGEPARVRMMSRTLPHADVWTIGAYGGSVHVAELACAGEQPAVVRFALGPEGMPPATVMAAAWAPRSAGNPVPYEEVRLSLPRFELRTSLAVHGHLPALGVELALDEHAAEFGGLSSEHLYLQRVDQECVVRVDEEGVQAAAVTDVQMAWMSYTPPPPTLNLAFDRPFACAVMDASGTVPLFAAYQATAPRPGGEPVAAHPAG